MDETNYLNISAEEMARISAAADAQGMKGGKGMLGGTDGTDGEAVPVADSADWTPTAYVTAECRITDLSPADLIAIFKSRSFRVTTVVACEHVVGRTRDMPSEFVIMDVPRDIVVPSETVSTTEEVPNA